MGWNPGEGGAAQAHDMARPHLQGGQSAAGPCEGRLLSITSREGQTGPPSLLASKGPWSQPPRISASQAPPPSRAQGLPRAPSPALSFSLTRGSRKHLAPALRNHPQPSAAPACPSATLTRSIHVPVLTPGAKGGGCTWVPVCNHRAPALQRGPIPEPNAHAGPAPPFAPASL